MNLNKIRAFGLSTRPITLLVSIVPVVLGGAIAYSEQSLRLSLSIVILITSILIQIATNFINEYYDYIQGVDNSNRLGPIRSMQAGFISQQEMRRAIYGTLYIAVVLGIYIATQTSIWILFLGILSVLSGLFYTYGKKSIAYIGLGEVFVFIFFGLVALPVTYYCNTLEFDTKLFLPGASVGFIASAILIMNNIRDYENDKNHSKNTLTVKIGVVASKVLYSLFLILPLILSIIYFISIGRYHFLVLILTYFFAAWLVISDVYIFSDPKDLKTTLFKTAILLLLYGILFIIILVLDIIYKYKFQL